MQLKKAYWAMLCPKHLTKTLHFKTYCLSILLLLSIISKTSKAQTTPSNIIPLKVGDTIPEALWNQTFQIRNHLGGKQITTLKEYKGKLIILDFWATWCGSCLTMLPKINTLQKQYSNQIQFLPITREPESKIDTMVEKIGWNPLQKLTYIISDTVLYKVFPHQGIPHYVWINSLGKVQAITGSADINLGTLDSVLVNSTQKLVTKTSLKKRLFDTERSLLSYQPLTDSSLLFSATLSPYKPGLLSMFSDDFGYYKNRRLLIINDKLVNLFRIAYAGSKYFRNSIHKGFPLNRTLVKMKDLTYWKRPENYLCYEQIQVKPNDDSLLKIMQQQLEMLLPIKARMEHRKLACYILVKQGKPEKSIYPTDSFRNDSPLHLSLHNQPANHLAETLNLYLKHPLIDETGNKEVINIELKTPLNDFEAVKIALQPWGFTLKPATRTIEVLVITDK